MSLAPIWHCRLASCFPGEHTPCLPSHLGWGLCASCDVSSVADLGCAPTPSKHMRVSSGAAPHIIPTK